MANVKLLMRMEQFADSSPITTPQPLHIYRVPKIGDAFRFMQPGKNDGKIVVAMTTSDEVPVSPCQSKEARRLQLTELDRCSLPSSQRAILIATPPTMLLAVLVDWDAA